MKYLVVSDNHGDYFVLKELADRYRGKVDEMFHCGDSELSPTDKIWEDFHVVTGNCDYDSRFSSSQLLSNGLDKIYLTHGHRSNVRFGLQHLFYEAEESEANIALYGHTHQLFAELVEGILIVNPGSISQPRGRFRVKTYAIIESSPEKYIVSFFDEHHQLLPELTREFKR